MSHDKRSDFQKQIDLVLRPKLIALGFQEVLLKDCMCPEVLLNRDRLWFGASWDYRDHYLEVELGHLFWFQDVMPRVIVLGDYATYCPELKVIPTDIDNYLRKVAEFVRDTIENAVVIYEKGYEEILAERRNPKKLNYPKEFFTHLGCEVSKSDLERFVT